MPIVSLNTNPSFTIRPSTTPAKQPLWNGRAIEPRPSDSSCLTQKELHFSDYIAPETAPTTTHFKNVEVLFFEWNPAESDDVLYFTYSPQKSDSSQESEWRFADRAPYIPKNDEENLTVKELLERTGYTFATFEDLQIIESKKVKDRVLGWWKSGVKWAKEHKKVLIVTGVVLGTGAFVAGVVLLASAATAEAAVATTAAVGAAVAGGSGPKKKDEEEEKPPAPQETASEPPPPPPFIPSIDFPPVTEKPQPPKETASASPPSRPAELPSIAFQPPTNGKSQPSKVTTSTPSNSLPAIDIQLPPHLSQIQSQAKTYSDYLIQQALHPLTSFPSLAVMPTPVEKPASPEAHHYTSMFQTILKGFSYIGTNAIDNLDLFRSDSVLDPFCNAYSDLMKKHNISSTPASPSQAEIGFPLLNIAPLKSTYYEYLNLLANYKAPISSFEGQPPCSIYHSFEGLTEEGMQVTFINGMDNRWLDFLGNIKHLGSLTKFQIDGVYNCTHGKFLDFAEILALNLAGSSPVTEEMLIKQFTDFAKINKNDPRAKCLHYCHSQGTLHTLNALEKLPKEVRERIIVVSIAGACVIPKNLCFDSFNYVSDKDVVYKLQDIYTNAGTLLANDAQQYEILKQQQTNAQEFIVLKAHEGATGLDHNFQSPTYVERIAYHLQDYGVRKGKY